MTAYAELAAQRAMLEKIMAQAPPTQQPAQIDWTPVLKPIMAVLGLLYACGGPV